MEGRLGEWEGGSRWQFQRVAMKCIIPQTIRYNNQHMEHFNSFFARHNLRPFMTIYLAVVHCLALVGMAYSLLHP